MASSYFTRGVEAAQEADLDRARELLELASKEEPGNHSVWLWLGSVAADLGEARQHFLTALHLCPDNQSARDWLAHIEALRGRETGDSEDSEAGGEVEEQGGSSVLEPEPSPKAPCPFCTSLTQAEPSDPCDLCGGVASLTDLDVFFAYFGGSPSHLLQASAEKLQASYQSGDPEYYYRLGLTYLNLGRFPEALFQLRLAQRCGSDDPDLDAAVTDLGRRLGRAPMETPPTVAGESGLQHLKPEGAEKAESRYQTSSLGPDEMAAAERKARRGRKVILVVDDSPTVRKLMSQTLSSEGYRVVTAESGLEALSRLREAKPALILLDISMPNLDGFQVCRVIQQTDSVRDIPIVLLSGRDGFVDKVRGRMAGAVEYLTKPVDPTVLRRSIEKYLAEQEHAN